MVSEDKGFNEKIEERRDKLFSILKNASWIYYALLAAIIWFGYYVRTRNLSLLIDVTTGKYLPSDPDAMLFLRYAEYILEHGKLMAIDALRYYPIGYPTAGENIVLPYVVVYLHKLISIFKDVTLQYVDVIFPALAFIFIAIFFYLFVKELFNHKVALLSTAFLTVIPTFLFRTMSGVTDKESLAFVLMFASLYFFALSWKSESLKRRLIYSGVSGILTGFMALTWGGTSFIFMSVGLFVLVEIVLNKFDKNDFYSYAIWYVAIAAVIQLFQLGNFTLRGMFMALTSGAVMTFALIIAIVKFLLFDMELFSVKKRFGTRLPDGIISLIIGIVAILIAGSIILGPGFFVDRGQELYNGLTEPFGETRWSLTVAENHQPYVKEWVGQMGLTFILVFMIGSAFLFYEMLIAIGIERWKILGLTGVYLIFLFGFIFSRYSPESRLNGANSLSIFLYLGFFAIFILLIMFLYIMLFFKNKEIFANINKIDKKYTFIFILFLLMLVGARSAARLMFVFSPVISIMAAYFFYILYDYARTLKGDAYKISIWIVLLVLLANPISFAGLSQGLLVRYSSSVLETSKYVGPNLDRQWQYAMKWARENTSEDAVFAHWWDYGYLVQYGARRATLSDGGNSRGAINYFTGRHLLTAQSDVEALELLKANNATHFLAINDEIGKYPAFSSIGSDVNYDRYSWISTFMLDTQDLKETRDGKMMIYKGGTALDKDFTYKGKLFPQGSAGIAGFFLPLKENGTEQIIEQPIAVLVYNGQQFNVPLKCYYLDNLFEFDGDGLDGCLRFIPTIDGQQGNPLGAGLYLSPKVRVTLFSRLFLFNEDSKYFKLVYDDSKGMPLAVYNGRLIGPLKIWEISYPDNLVIPKEYYSEVLPDPRVDRPMQ